MSTAMVLLLILAVLALAGVPYTGWHSWGWQPSGIVGAVLVVVLLLLLLGRL